MTSRAHRMAIAAAALFGAGVTVGCSASTPPPAAATSASVSADDDAAAGLMEHHRYHHHGGVTLFIAMSLDTLGVSPEQRAAVERIRSDLHARMAPARIAEQDLVTLLADGVATANLDAPKVDTAIVAVSATAAGVHDASVDALSELHNVLTPPERAARVDKVESHWAVWQNANAEGPGTANASDHLAILATDLGLTSDQVEKIRAALGERMRAVPKLDPQEVAAHLRVAVAIVNLAGDGDDLNVSTEEHEGWNPRRSVRRCTARIGGPRRARRPPRSSIGLATPRERS
jgi:Spy/CpxP family protein refolding chaperone